MSEQRDRTEAAEPARQRPPSAAARQARLAAALRDNLARRKQQARARADAERAEDDAD